MVDQLNNKPYIKGALSAEFGRTSIGTTPQDEQNIKLESPDGEGMFTARRDTYAYTANERSKRVRLDRDKKRSWQHLLFMINQLHKSIAADLARISDILDDMRELCGEILEFIDDLDTQIENIQNDHEYVTGILDQSGKGGLNEHADDPHIQALLKRYEERTGEDVADINDLSVILLAQIGHEQAVTIPRLHHRIEQAGLLYDEATATTQDISNQNDRLKNQCESLAQSQDGEQKLGKMEDLQDQATHLNSQAENKCNDIKAKLDKLQIDHAMDDKPVLAHQPNNNEKRVELKTFGINIPVPH